MNERAGHEKDARAPVAILHRAAVISREHRSVGTRLLGKCQ